MSRGNVFKIEKEAFQPYGEYYNFKEGEEIKGNDYIIYKMRKKIISRPLKFGITRCKNSKAFLIDSMERHLSSEEIQIVGDKPIILSVADSDPMKNPKEEDVVSFFLYPGDVVILKPGIWHDACHSIEGETMYFFLSFTNGDPRETDWLPVIPRPVSIEL